jgi:lipid-binding SYLF domain-containing protein
VTDACQTIGTVDLFPILEESHYFRQPIQFPGPVVLLHILHVWNHACSGEPSEDTTMKTLRASVIFGATTLMVVLGASLDLHSETRSSVLERIRNSQEVFHELMQAPDKAIPRELLESAKCAAIVPGEKKAAFIAGGSYGRGVAMCRNENGWSGPVFLTIAGGSFGFQIGGTSTDIVLVFRNRDGFQRLLSDKFKIGGDATAAVGPVGRTAAAATDLEMHAEILTYSRSRGIFAGVSLDGSVVAPDHEADEELYGKNVDPESVLYGKVPVPDPAQPLVAEIARYTKPSKAS